MKAFYNKLSSDWNENFMLYAALSIIASTCLGSMAVMAIFTHGNTLFQMLQIFLVVAVCNALLASILSVQKPKVVLNLLIVSLGVCALLAALNFLF
ncbi:hypothetical protein POV27_14165 [Aureisphaera galaxeae]|uniref:hypothetical protein n=1 Tax=Aureisphaera galaxeae TaxID=1538023 RepID=UPI00234FEDB4|nr:hypothetical protein [Aureisphaera galaxeae]MDC8005202.1 hypothetical protein [Aureisphaera galaxeae]